MKPDSRPVGCPTYSPEELSRFLDGDFSPRQQERLRQHLQECETCRQRLQQIQSVRDLLQRSPAVTSRRDFTLRECDIKARRPMLWYPVLRTATAAIAALVLVLFVGSAFVPGQQAPAVRTTSLVAIEPTLFSTPSLRPVAVEPMLTRRPLPTSLPGIIAPPTTTAVTLIGEPAYPAPPTLQTEETPLPTVPPAKQAEQPAGTSFLQTMKVGGLFLLGLSIGLTWLAYRRERMFLS